MREQCITDTVKRSARQCDRPLRATSFGFTLRSLDYLLIYLFIFGTWETG